MARACWTVTSASSSRDAARKGPPEAVITSLRISPRGGPSGAGRSRCARCRPARALPPRLAGAPDQRPAITSDSLLASATRFPASSLAGWERARRRHQRVDDDVHVRAAARSPRLSSPMSTRHCEPTWRRRDPPAPRRRSPRGGGGTRGSSRAAPPRCSSPTRHTARNRPGRRSTARAAPPTDPVHPRTPREPSSASARRGAAGRGFRALAAGPPGPPPAWNRASRLTRAPRDRRRRPRGR